VPPGPNVEPPLRYWTEAQRSGRCPRIGSVKANPPDVACIRLFAALTLLSIAAVRLRLQRLFAIRRPRRPRRLSAEGGAYD